MNKYSILSMFSGCGGLDLGFRGGFEFLKNNYKRNNFEIKWANDIDQNACKSYYNYFNHNIVCGDIVELADNFEDVCICSLIGE